MLFKLPASGCWSSMIFFVGVWLQGFFIEVTHRQFKEGTSSVG